MYFPKDWFISSCRWVFEKIKKEYPKLKLKEVINLWKKWFSSDFYFITSDENNIEIVISFWETNGRIDYDKLYCAMQKPRSSSVSIDNRWIDQEKKVLEFIRNVLNY